MTARAFILEQSLTAGGLRIGIDAVLHCPRGLRVTHGEIVAIVDHNKIQSDTWVDSVSRLGDLEAKFRAFGWHVSRCDGHDVPALERTFRSLDAITSQPKVIIADTVKGKGVSGLHPCEA